MRFSVFEEQPKSSDTPVRRSYAACSREELWSEAALDRHQENTVTGANDADLRAQILGTWTLVSYRACGVEDPNDVIYPLGPDPLGSLIYTCDGYMATQFMKSGCELFAHPDPHNATPDEMAAAAASYISYSWPFSIDNDTVVHHVAISLMPNWIGHDQRRKAHFDDSTLTLTAIEPLLLSGRSRIASLSWQRPR
jgi:hypothetical protein